MDLAAALQADPKNLPEQPSKKPANPNPGRGDMHAGTIDPYSFFFTQVPGQTPGTDPSHPTPGGENPGTMPPGRNPGINPSQRPTPAIDPMDCEEAAREFQKLQRQYEALLKRYGACL